MVLSLLSPGRTYFDNRIYERISWTAKRIFFFFLSIFPLSINMNKTGDFSKNEVYFLQLTEVFFKKMSRIVLFVCHSLKSKISKK